MHQRQENRIGRLFFLEASGGRTSANAMGRIEKVIVSGDRLPDGVVVDLEAGTNLLDQHGRAEPNDGSLTAPISTVKLA